PDPLARGRAVRLSRAWAGAGQLRPGEPALCDPGQAGRRADGDADRQAGHAEGERRLRRGSLGCRGDQPGPEAGGEVRAADEGVGSAAFDDLAAIADHSRPTNARFFAYVLGSGEPVAAIGDLYASVLNQNVTAWRSAPAAVTIERTVLRWLAGAVGCEGFTGS